MSPYTITEYTVTQRSGTSGNVGLIFLLAGLAAVGPGPVMVRSTAPVVSVMERESTVGQFENVLRGVSAWGMGAFEQAVGTFYANLLANQEPLGKDFERVLHENLWDLYERS